MADRITGDEIVAFATYDAHPAIGADDQLLADALARRGIRSVPAVWSDPAVDWSSHAAVLVRSCWDYHLRAAEFFSWTSRLGAEAVRVFNAADLLRWNAEKTYLRDLERDGVRIVPTEWIERGAAPSLDEIRNRTGWSELVVKPAISGGAHETWRASPGDGTGDATVAAMARQGVVLVQPLLDEVVESGEASLIFFDGRFSHAVFKRPRAGDFRVQIEHGGTFEPIAPDPSLIAQAERALKAAPFGGDAPLYARVDGCVVNGELLLMELELIEPFLFLGSSPGAADRLADAIEKRLVRALTP